MYGRNILDERTKACGIAVWIEGAPYSQIFRYWRNVYDKTKATYTKLADNGSFIEILLTGVFRVYAKVSPTPHGFALHGPKQYT